MMMYLAAIDDPEEKSKFICLYHKYMKLMYRVAYDILQNHQDAEDAVQQAFMAVIPHLHKIKNSSCPETRSYLVIIVERKSIDILRTRKKTEHVTYLEEAAGVSVPPPGDGVLADAMARLPRDQRQALLLRYDNGFTTREIAKMFGITQSGVRKLLARGKKALLAVLEEEGVTL